MEIRLVLIPLLGALTLALSIAGEETNNDASGIDSGASEAPAVGKTRDRKPVVWEENIPGLQLATESTAESAAAKRTGKTASASTEIAEI